MISSTSKSVIHKITILLIVIPNFDNYKTIEKIGLMFSSEILDRTGHRGKKPVGDTADCRTDDTLYRTSDKTRNFPIGRSTWRIGRSIDRGSVGHLFRTHNIYIGRPKISKKFDELTGRFRTQAFGRKDMYRPSDRFHENFLSLLATVGRKAIGRRIIHRPSDKTRNLPIGR